MKSTVFCTLATLTLTAPAFAQDLVGFDASTFGSVVLSNTQAAGQSDLILEQAIGDYNNEFINTYSQRSDFARLGRAIGRLDVLTDAGSFPCTAFLVGEDLLMTNHHCVPGILDHPRANATAIAAVQVLMGYTQEGVEAGTQQFMVNPIPVETSKPLDYTLLRVIGAKPGKTFGMLDLADHIPQDNDPYWVIGHPMGEAQRISREECRANAPAVSGNKVLHTCDTLPGNSGSPVIDATLRQVVALHHAGSKQNSVNYAIPMSEILRNSSVLKATSTNTAPPVPKTDPADTALARLATISDHTILETELSKIISEFPDSRAAEFAKIRLATLLAERAQTARITRENAASAELMAALVLTDPALQQARLQALIHKFPDSAVAGAAKATLTALQQTVQPGAKQQTTIQPSTAPAQKATIHPPGTRLKVPSIIIRATPVSSGKALSTAFGQVVLGAHIRGNWYALQDRPGRYVKVPQNASVDAPKTATPTNNPSQPYPDGSTIQIKSIVIYGSPSITGTRISTVFGKLKLGKHHKNGWYKVKTSAVNGFARPPAGLMVSALDPAGQTKGVVLKLASSLKIHRLPTSTSQIRGYLNGSVTLGPHIRDGWYAVHNRKDAFVRPDFGDTSKVSAPTPQPEPDPTYAPGSVIKVSSINLYASPSDTAKRVSTAYGKVNIGKYVGNGWYQNGKAKGRFVKPPLGATILSDPKPAALAPNTVIHKPGTVVKIPTIKIYAAPSDTSRVVSTAYGQIKLGAYVGNGWYKNGLSTSRYVKPPPKIEVVVDRKDALPIGTKIRFPGTLTMYEQPTITARQKGTVYGIVTVGRFVGAGWYTVVGKYSTYVRPKVGTYTIMD